MNAYWVDAGQVLTQVDCVDIWPIYEQVLLFELVFAPNRGRAKTLFVKRHSRDIEWCDIKRVRLVAKDVDRPEGFAKYDDPLWDEADRIVFGEEPEDVAGDECDGR